MIISGGVVPGGNPRSTVWQIAVTCVSATEMLAEGRKNILITAIPLSDCDSLYFERPENIEESLFAFIKANRAKIKP